MWSFASRPTTESFRTLADQLRLAEHTQVHPALWQRREIVAECLFRMADDPEQNASAYHALRLLVW